MNIEQFPDVVYMGGCHFHLITPEARRWVKSETTIKDPDEHIDIRNPGRVVAKMRLDLTVCCRVDPPPDDLPRPQPRDPCYPILET